MTRLEKTDGYDIARHVIISQLALLLCSFVYLYTGGGFLACVLFISSLLYAVIVFVWAAIVSGKSAFLAFGIVMLTLSPMLVYAKEIDGVLYFGSAYSVDYQQYLSVAYSLATHGLPFANPYLPSVAGFYHYGFTLPFASLLKISGAESSGFFTYSYAFFVYAAWVATLLLILIRLLFFKTLGEWIVAVGVTIFASSYKGIYGALLALGEGRELSGYDTPIGIKTFQNDIMFGVHYLYSAIFLLYVLAVLAKHRDNQLKFAELMLIGVVAFFTPLINAFSPLILGAIVGAFVLIKHWRSPMQAIRDHSVWLLAGALGLSYLGMRILDVYVPGLRMARLDFDPAVLAAVIFGIAINCGGLLFLYVRRERRADLLWQISSIALCILISCIWLLTIDDNMEGRFSISRRLGTFILLLLMVNIRFAKLDWRKALILAPASLTFIGQNYYFFQSHNYPARTVGIAQELFNMQQLYRLDNAAYEASDKYRFNFDLVTNSKSTDYPNSLGFRQYSPIDVQRQIPKPSEDVIGITFRNNTFTGGSKGSPDI